MRSTEQEQRTIEQKAKANSLSVSRYLVQCGINTPDNFLLNLKIIHRWLYLILHLLLIMIYEIHKIGVNINQLAIDNNIGRMGKGQPPASEKLEKEAEELQKWRAKIQEIYEYCKVFSQTKPKS